MIPNEVKLTHEFLINNENILKLVLLKLRYTATWNDIRSRIGDESACDVIHQLIHDDQLPTLHFSSTLNDDSFTHAFGTKEAWSSVYKPDSLMLELCGDLIPCGVLKKELTVGEFDRLEELAAKKINQWDGPYE